VGLELDASRTELGRFADIPVVDLDAHVTTLMVNLMVRMPKGPIQPYASGGVGMVRLTGSVDVPFLGSIFSVSADDVGWNAGAGVMIFPVPTLGLRADVRRFDTGNISWDDLTDISDVGDLPLPNISFWRATAGLTFKF
jgi:opacity protein-like surface antigen